MSICVAALAGCDRGFELRIELLDGGNRFSAAAFRKGLFFGERPITFCPERIIVEELSRDGPRQLARLRVRKVPCEPHHKWSIPLLGPDGNPLLSNYSPSGRIAIAVFTDESEVGGSGWMPVPR